MSDYTPKLQTLIDGLLAFLAASVNDNLALCGERALPASAFAASASPGLPGERINVDFLGMMRSPDGVERDSFADWDIHLGLELVASAGTDHAAQARAIALEFACRLAFDADPLCDGLLVSPLDYGEIEALLQEKPQSMTCRLGVHLTIPWVRLPKPEHSNE